ATAPPLGSRRPTPVGAVLVMVPHGSPPRSPHMAVRSRSMHLVVLAGTVLAAALLAGCGGGGGTHSTAPSGGGTTAGTSGFTSGVITAFGTIHMGSGADEKIFHVEHAMLKRVDDDLAHDGLNDDEVMFRVGMK